MNATTTPEHTQATDATAHSQTRASEQAPAEVRTDVLRTTSAAATSAAAPRDSLDEAGQLTSGPGATAPGDPAGSSERLASEGTLAHGALERATDVSHGELTPSPDASIHCANCSAALQGHYCSNCGQRYEPHIHSVGHFMHEAAENLTHADSRLWRTLWPLLVKPGFLTREFFEGRRVSYLPPFRLYLVISAIFFLLWAVLPGETKVVGIDVNAEAELGNNVKIVTPLDLAGDTKQKPDETPAERAKRICDGMTYQGPYEQYLQKRFAAGCLKVMQDHGNSFAQAFLANIPRSLFILLPGMALFMKLLYWRPTRHYVEHLLFFVHNHAFVFLLLSLYFLVKPLLSLISPTWPLTVLVYGYIAIYSYRAMRRFYQQGKWLTRTKFVVLSFAYFMGATSLLGLTALFSFLTV